MSHPLGHFFVINEAVYPIYTAPMYTDDLTIEQSWECLCGSLLNDAYGKQFDDLMGFIPRGSVLADSTVRGMNLSSYVLKQVQDLFRLSESITILEGQEPQGIPTEDQRLRLRSLYIPSNYLYTLPWHTLQTLKVGTTKESKKVMVHTWMSRAALTRKRLGALASMPQLQ